MALHLIKLCVGVDSVEDLAAWQADRLKHFKKQRKPLQFRHVTRQRPKRAAEILDGGSLYWVIKGYTAVRQPILDLKPVVNDKGVPHCAIVYSPEMIPVARRARAPFQGWRYLAATDAPPDLPKSTVNMPAELQRTLSDLGLL